MNPDAVKKLRRVLTGLIAICYNIIRYVEKEIEMLAKFAVTNFRGFRERIELDLTRHRDYEFNSFAISNGIVKNGIIYGPNGAGKSNFSLAIFDIVNHLSQKWKDFGYYANFANAAAADSEVTFEYEFKFGDTVVDYSYAKTNEGVLCGEVLVVNGVQKFKRTAGKFEIDTEEFPMDEAVGRKLAANANAVPVVNYLLVSYPFAEGHYLLKLRDFVDGMLWFRNLDERQFIGLDTGVKLIYAEIIRKHLVEDFAKFLKTVSNQEFNFVPPKEGDKFLFCRLGKGSMQFDLVASTGTKALALLYFWLKQLSGATFVFVDEFDAFYHFQLSFAVCKELFKLKCQVFLSSHNTFLMTNDLLRPDCNFVMKDNEVRPICDRTDKDLRLGHNIEKLYRGGAFE